MLIISLSYVATQENPLNTWYTHRHPFIDIYPTFAVSLMRLEGVPANLYIDDFKPLLSIDIVYSCNSSFTLILKLKQ